LTRSDLDVVVKRNDEISIDEIEKLTPARIYISRGRAARKTPELSILPAGAFLAKQLRSGQQTILKGLLFFFTSSGENSIKVILSALFRNENINTPSMGKR
jgi:hypothetical protein